MRVFKLSQSIWLQGLMKRWLVLMLALGASLYQAPLAQSQTTAAPAEGESRQNIELYQALLDLTNPWTVMCVAAHPDDEDGATLTVLRRKYGVHTVTLFSTFGEGGQNAIGPELYEELGAIRARETREAAAIQGSEPYFLGLRDFGFSKSADEAFRVWGHEEALRRMVQKIRELRPDVIITNHDTMSGHGHHQATGRLVLEAFEAAADSSRFPEQLRQGLTTWQVQRLFVRVNYEGGTASKPLEDEAERAGAIVSNDINERDPVRGSTYAEQALEALHRHASQGPWPQSVPAGGARRIRYRLARQSKQAPALPPHPQTFLDGMVLPERTAARLSPLNVNALLSNYTANRLRPQGILDALIQIRKTVSFKSANSEPDAQRFRLMDERLDHALAVASGTNIILTPRETVVAPKQPVHFSLQLEQKGPEEVRLRDVVTGCGAEHHSLDFQRLKVPRQLKPGTSFTVEEASYVPANAFINVPHAEHLYDGHLFGERCAAEAFFEINGAGFKIISAPQVDVAPPVEIANLTPSPLVLTPATLNRMLNFKLRLINHQPAPFKGDIMITSEDDGGGEVGPQVNLAAGESQDLSLKSSIIPVDTPDERRLPRPEFGPLKISLYRANSTTPVTERKLRVVYSDARVVPNLRVGYVPSFDNTLRNALDALGVEAKELTVEDVKAGRLQDFGTIIIDNRGYQAHPELIGANQNLLDYARSGGTLIVFYHKTNEWNTDPQRNRPQLAPYPLTLGNARVTDENAPVTFSEPQSPLLNFPNRIGPEDFAGWIQERGLYYPKEWDQHYTAPLSMSDAGEAPLRGGLLAADYGRGHYIYTSIVWYRQLRAGVPGAFRIFANMLSYGHTNR